MGKRGTGRKVSGGGKARQNKDHRRVSQRGIVKGRWDDIVAAARTPSAPMASPSRRTGQPRAASQNPQ